MALIESLGVRILGVELKETHLEAISKAVVDTIPDPEEILTNIGAKAIKFGELIVETDKYLSDSSPESLRELFEKSGLVEYKYFFSGFLENLSKKETLVNMLSGLGSVTSETGSLRLKFRNRARKIGELRVDLKNVWKEIRKREKEIRNSFTHLAEFARRTIDQIPDWVVHTGLYGAAFVLVILSLWYSVAFSVASGLSTLASNLFNSLKTAFPIISFIIFIACIIYDAMEAREKFGDAYNTFRRIVEGHSV